MGDFAILKPAFPGVSTRDPKTGIRLPDEGKAVRLTTFWKRRLEDGSVVEVKNSTSLSAPETPAEEQ